MKFLLLKVFISLTMGTAFVLGYGSFCDYFFTQRRFLDLTEKKQWILAQEGGMYDYAVLGSSRAFGAFDMNLLDSLTGLNGINLGANGSGFKDNYLVLTLFLKSNQIKKLLLQVDMASLNSKISFSNEFHGFTFIPFWEEEEVRKVLKEEIPLLDNPISAILPQWRYFYFNKYFSPKEVIRRAKLSEKAEDNYFKSKGGILGKDKIQGEKQIKTYNLPSTADPVDWNYLMKIISKAEAEGIEVVFFTAPRYQDRQEELFKLLADFPHNKVFPCDFDSSNADLFQDQGHLNWYGRRDFSSLFSKKIAL